VTGDIAMKKKKMAVQATPTSYVLDIFRPRKWQRMK